MRIRIHTITGEVIEGTDNEVTDEEAEEVKGMLADVLSDSKGGGYISAPTAGGWVAVPARSVFYVEGRT